MKWIWVVKCMSAVKEASCPIALMTSGCFNRFQDQIHPNPANHDPCGLDCTLRFGNNGQFDQLLSSGLEEHRDRLAKTNFTLEE